MPNPRKVLHIVGAKVWGGGEQYVYDVCRESAKRGMTVYIALDRRRVEMTRRFAEVATIIPVTFRGFTGLNALGRLARAVRREKIEIIHNHSGHFSLLARLLKSATGASLLLFKHNSRPGKRDCYHRWLHQKIDRIICVSEMVYRLQTDGLSEKEKARYRLVYNGVPADRFESLSERKERGSVPPIVGYAGRIYSDKGITPLLDAFALFHADFPDSILRLAGPIIKGYDGTFREKIAEHRLKNAVEYLGPQDEMEAFYKSVDVLAVPSLFREPFGLVICESALCGTPVIASDSGGQVEIIIDGETGLIVPTGDVEALADAFRRFFGDPALQSRLAENGRRHVLERFTIERCVDDLSRLYEEILGRVEIREGGK